MKNIAIIFVVLFAVAIAVTLAGGNVDILKRELDNEDDDGWAAFKLEYRKKYRNAAEDNRRHKIYLQNKKMVENHNKLYAQKKSINDFSDLTQKEFSEMYG
ncbi:cathepsin L-like isoform X2 [Contarinia nasturtii]|uniref:cathepsin L-like isoform X2 n=1 Tax=Contarinia nasturtii TaxID=265458 RepID=UPI0012D476A3|nr:cathepsin L-like isoform X2 [Contarinia nasturtii]